MITNELFFAFSLIPFYFFIAFLFNIFILNTFLKKEVCSVCASVSLTWITLLILYLLGKFGNVLILGILMGATSAGLFHLLEKKLKIFKFPFILTLFFLFYSLLTFTLNTQVLYLLITLWLIFSLLSLSKSKLFRE